MLCFFKRKTSTTVVPYHYCVIIMGAMTSQITGVSGVRSIVCSGSDQRKYQSFASLAFKGIHRRPAESSHKGPVTGKCFHVMTLSLITGPIFSDVACSAHGGFRCTTWQAPKLHIAGPSPRTEIQYYPMLRADSRFWLFNNREIWSRISRLTSSAWDIKTKERHWWRHNGDSDRRPLSLPLRYDLVTLCLYDDLGQINVIAGILKLRKRFRMSQILFEHGINSLPLVCFRGYGNLSTLSIAIPRLAFGRAWYCDAACG